MVGVGLELGEIGTWVRVGVGLELRFREFRVEWTEV